MDLHKNNLQYLFSENISLDSVYIPQYHLYPTHPQILHHLMIELFVHVPKVVLIQKDDRFDVLPSGPVFRVGGRLAALWKRIFAKKNNCTEIVLLNVTSLPPDIAGITTTHTGLHSFFGIITVPQNSYASGFLQSADMFSLYAKGIEAQLPFIRAYKNISVIPYILNSTKDQQSFDDMVDTIYAHHGDNVCYVFVLSEDGKEKVESYLG